MPFEFFLQTSDIKEDVMTIVLALFSVVMDSVAQTKSAVSVGKTQAFS